MGYRVFDSGVGIVGVAFALVLLAKDLTELAPDAKASAKLKLVSLSLCEGVTLLFIELLLSTLARREDTESVSWSTLLSIAPAAPVRSGLCACVMCGWCVVGWCCCLGLLSRGRFWGGLFGWLRGSRGLLGLRLVLRSLSGHTY
jgi:hypothetical protein